MSFEIVSDRVAAAQIVQSRGAYHLMFGAGLSAEAGVPTADQICAEIARSQLQIGGFGENVSFDDPAAREWLARNLAWDRADERYASCIRKQFRNPADRVDFFRQTLSRVRPSFAHHGTAMLMNDGVLARTCFTTNFDKLLEYAFASQGNRECQAIRTANEIEFWRPDPDRCFCLKLHGDYDTHNVLNTSEETVRLDKALKARCARLLEHHGLAVVGLAGYEKSVYSFFEDLTTEENIDAGMLNRGLLWGVYVGPKPYVEWTAEETERQVLRAINAGGVGPEVRKLMARMATARVQCAFFPLFGAGTFMMDLIEATRSRALIGQAEPYLDHKIRLRRVFRRASLSPARLEQHIRNLKFAQPASASATKGRAKVERAFALERGAHRVWLAYGNIASRSFLGHADFRDKVRAVVSPDDTFLSVGGGVAVALAEKAGLRSTLHEVSKFSPIPQGESRVTSGGDLPVHYIMHAATIEVAEDGYRVDSGNVTATFRDVLRQASALRVGTLFVPMLGAGVAGLSSHDSLRGLLAGYKEAAESGAVPEIVVFVVFLEGQLGRGDARQMIEEVLARDTDAWTDEAWPPA